MSCAAPAARSPTSTAPSVMLPVSPPPTTTVSRSTRRRSSTGAPAPTVRPTAPPSDPPVRKEASERNPGQRPLQRAGCGREGGRRLPGRARLGDRARQREREPGDRLADPEDRGSSAYQPGLVAQPARSLGVARPLVQGQPAGGE